jgi:hypothetical protein
MCNAFGVNSAVCVARFGSTDQSRDREGAVGTATTHNIDLNVSSGKLRE